MNLQIIPDVDRPVRTAGLSEYTVTTVAHFDARAATRDDLFKAARTIAEEVWESPSGCFLIEVYAERREAFVDGNWRRSLMDLRVRFTATSPPYWITFWEDGTVDCK